MALKKKHLFKPYHPGNNVKRVMRVLYRFIGILLFLFLLLFLFVQIPSVQSWATRSLQDYLQSKTKTNVHIGNISLNFFEGVKIKELYIEDLHKDTLLYAKEIIADLSLNPIGLMNNKLVVDKVTVNATTLHILTYSGEEDSNLDQIIALIFPPSKTPSKSKPLQFAINNAFIASSSFMEYDQNTGNYLNIYALLAKVAVDKLDFAEKKYAFKSGFFDNPQVVIQNYNPSKGSIKYKPVPVSTGKHKTLDVSFGRIRVVNGYFSNDDFTEATDLSLSKMDDIDYKHLKVANISIKAQKLKIFGQNYSADPFELSLTESKGFKLEKLSSSHVEISPTKAELKNMLIKTPYSSIGDSIVFTYNSFKDWNNFNDDIKLKVNFNKSEIAIRDVATFMPELKKLNFFKSNYDEKFKINGIVKGKINDLNAKNLEIEIRDQLKLIADFSSKDLAVSNQEMINLNIKELSTKFSFLKSIIPDFNLPPAFSKLGNLNFKGQYDGFFTDFVAFGTLTTDLGAASMDMRMNLNNGRDNAEYSGTIKLIDFNLGSWTNESKLGKLNAYLAVKNGYGLSVDKANAQLEGLIQNISYNGYQYTNVIVNGSFKKNIIDGIIQSNDPNALFDFNGKIDLTGERPKYNFTSNVKNINLLRLNLAKEDFSLLGRININLESKGLNDISGTASVSSFQLKKAGELVLNLDTLNFVARQFSTSNKDISLRSDLVDVDLEGNFDIGNLDKIFLSYLEKAHPRYYADLGLPVNPVLNEKYKFDYTIDVKDAKPLTNLINKKINIPNGFNLTGGLNSIYNILSVSMNIPAFKMEGYEFQNTVIYFKNNGLESSFNGTIEQAVVSDKILPNFGFNFWVNNDSTRFDISGLEIFKSDLSSNGVLTPMPNGYKLHFTNDKFNILGENWTINPANNLFFEKERISSSFFYLTNKDKQILVNNAADDGLELAILGFDLGLLNKIINFEQIQLSGKIQIYAKVSDVYKLKNFGITINTDSLYLNKDLWGSFALNANAIDLKNDIYLDYSIVKNNASLSGRGFINLADQEGAQMNVKNKLINVPLKTLEYFIGDGIAETTGGVTGDFNVSGPVNKFNTEGAVEIKNGGFKLLFTQTKYTIKEGKVAINNSMIDASNCTLEDADGNIAKVTGGLVHNHFRQMGYRAKIESDKFNVLNTNLGDNELFYGHGLCKISMNITGTFEKTDMYINLVTSKGSNLTIPFGTVSKAKASSYVKFVSHQKDTTQNIVKTHNEESGLNIDIDLSITEDVLMQIILDPKSGDYIKGYGRGNIQIAVTRTKEFSMYGDFEIENGEYLFTLLNIVNKPFLINAGSTVRWTGDPLEGEVNLTANYKDLYTSPYNFILEYLVDDNSKNEAKKSTRVDLSLNLTGRLLQPTIKLDIDFPNISPTLRNYVDSKLRIIRQDQNEMNRQAMALIVTKTFLPPNTGFQGTQYTTSINTLSELLSRQLSYYITDLFSGIINENSIVTGIDLDIGYNVNDASLNNPFKSSEFQLRLKNNLFSDRLTINVGGNVGTNENNIKNLQSDTYVTGDLEVTWALTADNRLKVRMYQRSEPALEGGRKNRTGIGISYRREFDTFSELLSELKSRIKK